VWAKKEPAVARGDWTMDEVHLCNIRLRLRRLDTMPGHRRAAWRRPAGGV
jgi:hypothetical protein